MEITRELVYRILIRLIKQFKLHKNGSTKLVFIMGYGRSGTSFLLKLLDHSFNTEVHGEKSKKLMIKHMLKKQNVDLIRMRSKADVLIAKPILNSFQIKEILEEYKDLKIIWLIRLRYKDVVNSALKAFGTRVGDYLSDYTNNHDRNKNNWIAKTVPEDIINSIEKLDIKKFSKYDWMALVWWAVNQTILNNNLQNHERVKIISYEDLVKNPYLTLEKIEKFIGVKINKESSKYVFSSSIGKGDTIVLNNDVQKMCDDIQRKFEIKLS